MSDLKTKIEALTRYGISLRYGDSIVERLYGEYLNRDDVLALISEHEKVNCKTCSGRGMVNWIELYTPIQKIPCPSCSMDKS